MRDFYRKKSNAVTAFLKDKSFYIILFASMVMVCIAGWLALGTGEEPADDPVPGAQVDSGDSSSKNNENKFLPDKEPENTVGSSVENIPAESDPGTSEPEEIVVKYLCPVGNYTDISEFSGTVPVFSETLQDWRLHTGVDYITDDAEDVFAAADGIIEDIYDDGLMGITVVISHAAGMKTVYQSLSDNVNVIRGAEILQGDKIATTGTTASAESTKGKHLHFSVLKDGGYLDPEDIYEKE